MCGNMNYWYGIGKIKMILQRQRKITKTEKGMREVREREKDSNY